MDNMGHPAGNPATAGGSRRHRPVWTAAVLAVACGAAAVIAALWWPRTTVVDTFEQPAGIEYADNSAHVAVLKHIRATIGLAPGRYEVVLGRDPGGDYGHRVRLDATGMDPADLGVEWTPDGAWLIYRSEHRVYVPATSFIGGR